MVYLKFNKPLLNNFPKLRPILSVINTATDGRAKFFVPLLKSFTMNEYTVDSLFTVPLDETIKICIDELLEPEDSF